MLLRTPGFMPVVATPSTDKSSEHSAETGHRCAARASFALRRRPGFGALLTGKLEFLRGYICGNAEYSGT